MRLIRMFTNAALVGLLGAAYVTALVLQVNPQIPLVSSATLHWFVAALSVHGLLVTVAVWVALIIRDAFTGTALKPAWLSVRVLAWTSAATAGAAAACSWGNLSGFRSVLDTVAAGRLRTGATVITICAVLLFLIALARFSFGRRGRPYTGALLSLVLTVSILVPLGVRGIGDVQVPVVPPPAPASPPALVAPSVHMILLDGASIDYVRHRVAAGQLPNFGSIVDRGAIVPLATLRPTQPEPVWAAAATGKYPPKSGVRSSSLYRARQNDTDAANLLPDYMLSQALLDLGAVIQEDPGASTLRSRTLWDILADFQLSAGIVRWPLTSPARATRGFVISDRFEQTSSSPLRLSDSTNGAPTTAAEIARGAFDETQFTPWTAVLPDDTAPTAASSTIARARWDRSYNAALARLSEQFTVDLTAIRYTGIDVLSRPYFGYSEPGRLVSPMRNVSPDEQARFGGALDRYYRWVDEQIGATIAQLRTGDLLLVVSGFGMDPVSLPHLLMNRLLRLPEDSGTHEDAPDGFLMAFGSNVVAGAFPRGAIVDVAPTVLYYMGVPIGRDMDGFARSDIFQRTFTLGRPMTFISTHER
jgi:predicted AlkP superfamily phosphohydrolase/phosphomutase